MPQIFVPNPKGYPLSLEASRTSLVFNIDFLEKLLSSSKLKDFSPLF